MLLWDSYGEDRVTLSSFISCVLLLEYDKLLCIKKNKKKTKLYHKESRPNILAPSINLTFVLPLTTCNNVMAYSDGLHEGISKFVFFFL